MISGKKGWEKVTIQHFLLWGNGSDDVSEIIKTTIGPILWEGT